MAGCFGNSAEDKAMERELYRWLDEQDAGLDALETRIESLFETAATEEGAAKLEFDWELLLNQLPAIVRLISEAKIQAPMWQPERKERMAALGEDLVLMLGDEFERIATHQMENE